jgi:serine/threonine-protein kinase HipA
MGRRSHAKALALYMNSERVGTWRIDQGHDALSYADSWLNSPNARPISLRFPLRPASMPYIGREVGDYFDNLLPDTKVIRERIARRFRLNSIEPFALLSAIGRDCVGALQILPEGDIPPNLRRIQSHPCSDSEVATLLRDTSHTGIARASKDVTEDVSFRFSLAGAQEKTALLRRNDAWHIPQGATPTTHILKLPMGSIGNLGVDMRDSVENEWLCAKIIETYGIPIARCEIAQFEDQKALVVERFDRALAPLGGWIMRLPQEDMCQALGISYLNKYESDGGPSIDDIMNLLRTAERGFDDRRIFFACQVLFWMLAATDGHAKNFSLHLKAGGTYSLTPLYDVISAYPVMGGGSAQIAPQKARLAMGVRGERNIHYRLSEIQRRHWQNVAKRSGIGTEANTIIDELIARTPNVITMVQQMLPRGFPARVAEPILNGLKAAAGRLS